MFRFSIYDLVTDRIPMFVRLGRDNLGMLFLPGVALVLIQRRNLMDRFTQRAFIWATFWPLNYGIGDIDSYFMVSFACVCIALGRGVMTLGAFLKDQRRVAWLAAAVVLVVAADKVRSNLPRVDESRDRQAEIFGAMVKAEVGMAGAVLLSPNYASSEALWYHTLGQGLQRSRRMYVVHHVEAAAVASYLRNGVPMRLPEQPGVTVPPHLRVIAIGGANRKTMESAGLTTVPLPARLVLDPAVRDFLIVAADTGDMFEVK
jgi:hypothetical protein